MPDENRETETSKPQAVAARSQRDLIEALAELVRKEDTSTTDIDKLLVELSHLLDQCVASQIAEGIYEDAVQRAPWLTADAERLKQQQSALRQSLQALRMLVSRGGGLSESFAQRFHEFVELYTEHEAAEQDFLQAAFPGPEWALQS